MCTLPAFGLDRNDKGQAVLCVRAAVIVCRRQRAAPVYVRRSYLVDRIPAPPKALDAFGVRA